jgi:tryptophanyl-tRNA synthetase
MRSLLENVDHIDHILDGGAARAGAIAAPIIDEVNEIVGFLGRKS